MATKKPTGPVRPTAAERTVPMFQEPVAEYVEGEAKGERLTIEQDANRLRDNAFTGQEWASKVFGSGESDENDYRVSFKNDHYYVEELRKEPGKKEAYGYFGLMVHKRNLMNLTTALVLAARAQKEAKK